MLVSLKLTVFCKWLHPPKSSERPQCFVASYLPDDGQMPMSIYLATVFTGGNFHGFVPLHPLFAAHKLLWFLTNYCTLLIVLREPHFFVVASYLSDDGQYLGFSFIEQKLFVWPAVNLFTWPDRPGLSAPTVSFGHNKSLKRVSRENWQG